MIKLVCDASITDVLQKKLIKTRHDRLTDTTVRLADFTGDFVREGRVTRDCQATRDFNASCRHSVAITTWEGLETTE
jgi:hypothetical protein